MQRGAFGLSALAPSPGPRLRTAALTLAGVVLLLGSSLAGTPTAAADPGQPGIPQPPRTVFAEDFSNSATTIPISLADYRGADPAGQRYTADPNWLDTACNGSVVRADMAATPVATGCTGRPWGGARLLSWALGALQGNSPAAAFENYALTEYTETTAGPGVILATQDDIQLGRPNRFLLFSVDAVAVNCNLDDPALRFSVIDGGNRTLVGGELEPCSGSFSAVTPTIPGVNGSAALNARGATLQTKQAYLTRGASFGLELRNEQGSGNGNDQAVDNIVVLDATPQLDQSFADRDLLVGDTTTLTYTITNTTDLAAKAGWSFANTLPDGLEIAGEPETSCAGADVNAAEGADVVAVANAALGLGQTSCEVQVPVLATTAGTLTNEPGSAFRLVGLDPGAAASVSVQEPAVRLSLTKSANDPVDTNGSGRTDAGDTINYRFGVKNTGTLTARDIRVDDPLIPSSAIDCPSSTLAPGETLTCSGTYQITQLDVDNGRVVNSATVTALDPSGGSVESATSNEATTATEQRASLAFRASAAAPTDANDNGRTDAGDTIALRSVVTNTGTLSLTDLTVDGTLGARPNCGVSRLAPGDRTTCTSSYQITQDDVQRGSVVQVASASATRPNGRTVTSRRVTVRTSIEGRSQLRLSLRGGQPTDRNGNGTTEVKDTIAYAVTATNGGDVPLTDLTIRGPKLPGIRCGKAEVAPGRSVTCRPKSPYAITAADLDAGTVFATAAATAQNPTGRTISSNRATTRTTVIGSSGLVLTQRAEPIEDVNRNGRTDAGDQVSLRLGITNAGSTTLRELMVDDPLLDDAGVAVSCAAGKLAPGAKTTCTTDGYPLSAADVAAHSIVNVASVTGITARGTTVASQDSSLTVSLEATNPSSAPEPPQIPGLVPSDPPTAPTPPGGSNKPGLVGRILSVPVLAGLTGLLLVLPELLLLAWRRARRVPSASVSAAGGSRGDPRPVGNPFPRP